MNVPTNLKFSKSHEWVEKLNGKAKIGITDYAQDNLTDNTNHFQKLEKNQEDFSVCQLDHQSAQ